MLSREKNQCYRGKEKTMLLRSNKSDGDAISEYLFYNAIQCWGKYSEIIYHMLGMDQIDNVWRMQFVETNSSEKGWKNVDLKETVSSDILVTQ